MKTCIECQKSLPATRDYFHHANSHDDKLSKRCIDCLENFRGVEDVPVYKMNSIPNISDELAEFYKKVADSLATKHIIKN